MIFLPSLQRLTANFFLVTAWTGYHAAGELKADINRDSKNLDTVTETGDVKWSTDTTNAAATGTAALSRSFTTSTGEAVTVTLAQTEESAAAGGTGPHGNWHQTDAQDTSSFFSNGNHRFTDSVTDSQADSMTGEIGGPTTALETTASLQTVRINGGLWPDFIGASGRTFIIRNSPGFSNRLNLPKARRSELPSHPNPIPTHVVSSARFVENRAGRGLAFPR